MMSQRGTVGRSLGGIEAVNSSCDLPTSKSSAGLGAGGKHMSTVRSLGLLHELQEYVESLEATAAEQRKQLGRLKEEKRMHEKVLLKELKSLDRPQVMQQFEVSEVTDLPPRLRALVEDNKVLREEVRRYRSRMHELEREAAAGEARRLALQDQVKTLTAAQQGALSAAEQLQLEEELEDKCAAVKRLEQKLAILQQKVDTDGRSHRQAAAVAAKERSALEQQIQKLQQQLDEKDREARAAVLTSKQATKQAEEATAAAKKQAATTKAKVQEAVAAALAQHKQELDKQVHLMLCIIQDPSPANTKQPQATYQELLVQAQQAAQLQQHGISISKGPCRYNPEQAAVKIQAAMRGCLARRNVSLMRQWQHQSALVIQAGTDGSQAATHPSQQQEPQVHAAAAGTPEPQEDAPNSSSSSSTSFPTAAAAATITTTSSTGVPGDEGGTAGAGPATSPQPEAGTSTAATHSSLQSKGVRATHRAADRTSSAGKGAAVGRSSSSREGPSDGRARESGAGGGRVRRGDSGASTASRQSQVRRSTTSADKSTASGKTQPVFTSAVGRSTGQKEGSSTRSATRRL